MNRTIMISATLLLLSVVAVSGWAQTSRAAAGKPASSPEAARLAREAQEAAARADWEGAARASERLIKLAPGVGEFHFNLGIAYFSLGRPQDAVPVLRRALKLKPNFAPARHFLGTALAESGQCPEALPMLKRDAAQIADRELKRSAELAGVRCAMKLNQLDEAAEFISLVNRDFPRDPEVLYLAVHIYSDLSIRASQDLLLSAPSSYQVRLLNAEALETQGKWDDAAAEYRQVLTANPRLPGIHYRLGRLLLSVPEATAAQMSEAKRHFEEELTLDPNNAGAEYVLGELARRDHEWPAAVEHFARAAGLDPTFADAQIGLGRALIAARRFAESVAPLEAAIKLQPDNPAGHYHLAIAYSRLGRKEEAERESAVFRQTSEKMRQARQEVQAGVLGPQQAEP